MQGPVATESDGRRPGRPRGYDIDEVTAAALETLWAKGYGHTSVEDLVKATGLGPSSLYAAFGSKRGVMEAALARYSRDRDAQLAPLEHGTRGLADLRAFLDTLREGIAAEDSRGCFMVNTSAGAEAHDPQIAEQVATYRARLRDGLAVCLTRAVQAGEIAADPDEVTDQAHIIQAALFGIQLVARSGPVAEARAALDALDRCLTGLPGARASLGESC